MKSVPPTTLTALAFALTAALTVLAPAAAPAFEFSGTARAIDGDSLVIDGQEMRLQGIDAPEFQQSCSVAGKPWQCGRAATEALAFLLARRPVRCLGSEYDHYQRALVTCRRGEVNINAMMVEIGMALAYRRHSHAYIAAEDSARAARRGLWDSEFITPWDWRRSQRTADANSGECAVKGNVNARGDKIYHRQGDRDYARVKIRAEQGDRCFDNEGDARAAGFRAARR